MTTAPDTCRHEEIEGECTSCASCAACQGECGACLYAGASSEPADYRAAFFRVSGRCDELKAKVSEHQWNALEMARKADAAERRAEEAEYHVEQLRDARDRAERRIERLEADLTQEVEALEELATPDITPSGDMRSAFALAARGLRAAIREGRGA